MAANAIYRAVTEKHAFYSCETVRNAVTSQFIRDLKGTIVSLFNENSPLGKNYVFDIRRTCREVYDHTRRILYHMDQQPSRRQRSHSESDTATLDLPEVELPSISGEKCTDKCIKACCKVKELARLLRN